MNKKFILFIVSVLSIGMIGCTSNKQVVESNVDRKPVKVVEFTNKEDKKEQPKISEEEEKAKQEKLQKEIQENNIVHADLIKEMKSEFANITNIYIANTDEGKTMNITIPLEKNKDTTIYKCAEITSLKETILKNEGITDISIKINNKDEHAGFIFFALRNGRYEPTLNTL